MPTRSLVATRLIGDAPTVDGQVDDDAWAKVAPYTDFVQVDPNLGQPASEKTEVRVTFDDQQPLRRRDRLRHRARQDHLHAEQARRRPHRLGFHPVHLRHLQRSSERLRVRHQSVGRGVRRAGGRRRRYRLVGPVRRRRRRIDARRARRLQRQLGCRLDGAGASHRARLGSRDGDSAQDAALRLGHRQDLGIQRRAQHPAQERAGLPAAGPARLQPHPGVGGRATDRARPAEAPRPQAHAVRRRRGISRTTASRSTPATAAPMSASTSSGASRPASPPT